MIKGTADFAAAINSVASRIVDMVITGEDGTIPLSSETGLPSSGYYVGGSCSSMILEEASEIHIRNVIEFITRTPNVDFYGVWTDQETGMVYIDAVDHYESLEDALLCASKRGEIAIWDVARSEELRLDTLGRI